MFTAGELVWVKDGLFMRDIKCGFGLVIREQWIDLEECQMASWFVLLDGKLVEVDSSHLKQLIWYNKHIKPAGFLGRAI